MSTKQQAILAPVSHGRFSPISNNSDWRALLINKVKKQLPLTTLRPRYQPLHRHHHNENNCASPSFRGTVGNNYPEWRGICLAD